MKISYERLNQIIEEEVVRFKKLNEETTTTVSLDAASKANPQKLAGSIMNLVTADKLAQVLNVTELLSLYTKLGGK